MPLVRADGDAELPRHKDRGQTARAIAELLRPAEDSARRACSVDLLVDLGAFPEALRAIEALATQGTHTALLTHARVLEGVGRTDQARAKYAAAVKQGWNAGPALLRLFYMDLGARDSAKAVSSYAALRARGFEADPFLRHRLALLTAFPFAPWQARDLLGLLALIALALACAFVPLAWVLPLHYVGLWQATRSKLPLAAEASRWSLRHLWALSATLLLSQLSAAYIWCDEIVESWFFQTVTRPEASDTAVARYVPGVTLLAGVGLLPWLRRGDYARLIRSRWSPWQVIRNVVGGVLVVIVVQSVWNRTLVPEAGAVPTSLEAVRALVEVHGYWVALPIVAVLVPLYEELLFRSAFLSLAWQRVSFAWANFAQAALFALAHQEPARMPGLFTLALIAGHLVRKSGGLSPAIALHATVNGLALCALGLGLHAGAAASDTSHAAVPPTPKVPARAATLTAATNSDEAWRPVSVRLPT